MFTGIITDLGTVVSLTRNPGDGELAVLTLEAPDTVARLAHGASVAVNGVCLSAVERSGDVVVLEVMGETLRRTTTGSLATGDRVNLELPMRPDGFLDGHVVQGHVDGTGTVLERRDLGSWEQVRVGLPRNLAKYVCEKGSIAIDGVSLTVTAVSEPGAVEAWFEVGLIPITRAETVLGSRPLGAPVNLEVDVLAKYLERMKDPRWDTARDASREERA